MEKNSTIADNSRGTDRRKFISTITKAVASSVLFVPHLREQPPTPKVWTVGEVMDLFIRQIPGPPLTKTVDTLKAGNRDVKITGIVTTMFATIAVIEKAIELKANFIIAHEPTFYNHLDETRWLEDDPVYRYKSELLARHQMAIWRNHDYVHSLQRDGVLTGLVARLGWQRFQRKDGAGIFDVPERTAGSLIDDVKKKLDLPMVRYVGDLTQRCRKVLVLPGAAGGRTQITLIRKERPDVVLCGEIAEWETAEYVRDARAMGQGITLAVLGHIGSEEPGSEFVAEWLKANVEGVTVTHVPAGNSLMFT